MRESILLHTFLCLSPFLKNIFAGQDASLTYEGDNYVLMEQTARSLLTALKAKQSSKPIISPFGSLKYFNDFEHHVCKNDY